MFLDFRGMHVIDGSFRLTHKGKDNNIPLFITKEPLIHDNITVPCLYPGQEV